MLSKSMCHNESYCILYSHSWWLYYNMTRLFWFRLTSVNLEQNWSKEHWMDGAGRWLNKYKTLPALCHDGKIPVSATKERGILHYLHFKISLLSWLDNTKKAPPICAILCHAERIQFWKMYSLKRRNVFSIYMANIYNMEKALVYNCCLNNHYSSAWQPIHIVSRMKKKSG